MLSPWLSSLVCSVQGGEACLPQGGWDDEAVTQTYHVVDYGEVGYHEKVRTGSKLRVVGGPA